MSTSSWTTMGPTRRHSSGGGLRNVHASMSTTRPPTGPGSTWSSGGLPNSPTSKSAAGFTAVSANWRPPSANSSPPTTKPPSLSFGPKPPTKSSPASLATRNALSPPNPGNLSHEPLGQETRGDGGWARLLQLSEAPFDLINTNLPCEEREMQGRLRDICKIPRMSTFAIGAIINLGVWQMPDDQAFVDVGVWNGFTFLAGMIGNSVKRCIGIDNFRSEE